MCGGVNTLSVGVRCEYLECGCVVGELYGLASLGVDGLTQLIQYHRRRSGEHTNTKRHTHAAFHSIQNTQPSPYKYWGVGTKLPE